MAYPQEDSGLFLYDMGGTWAFCFLKGFGRTSGIFFKSTLEVSVIVVIKSCGNIGRSEAGTQEKTCFLDFAPVYVFDEAESGLFFKFTSERRLRQIKIFNDILDFEGLIKIKTDVLDHRAYRGRVVRINKIVHLLSKMDNGAIPDVEYIHKVIFFFDFTDIKISQLIDLRNLVSLLDRVLRQFFQNDDRVVFF